MLRVDTLHTSWPISFGIGASACVAVDTIAALRRNCLTFWVDINLAHMLSPADVQGRALEADDAADGAAVPGHRLCHLLQPQHAGERCRRLHTYVTA